MELRLRAKFLNKTLNEGGSILTGGVVPADSPFRDSRESCSEIDPSSINNIQAGGKNVFIR